MNYSIYLTQLQTAYDDHLLMTPGASSTKLTFVGEYVFDFSTYEQSVLKLMTKRAIEVAIAISAKETVEYIDASESNNFWFLMMTNVPFFADNINWGTSVNSCWWDRQSTPDIDGDKMEEEDDINFFNAIRVFVDKEWGDVDENPIDYLVVLHDQFHNDPEHYKRNRLDWISEKVFGEGKGNTPSFNSSMVQMALAISLCKTREYLSQSESHHHRFSAVMERPFFTKNAVTHPGGGEVSWDVKRGISFSNVEVIRNGRKEPLWVMKEDLPRFTLALYYFSKYDIGQIPDIL